MKKVVKTAVAIFTLVLLAGCNTGPKDTAYFEKHPDEIKPTLEKCNNAKKMTEDLAKTCSAAGQASNILEEKANK